MITIPSSIYLEDRQIECSQNRSNETKANINIIRVNLPGYI